MVGHHRAGRARPVFLLLIRGAGFLIRRAGRRRASRMVVLTRILLCARNSGGAKHNRGGKQESYTRVLPPSAM